MARGGTLDMPLNVYPNVYASGSVPAGWTPTQGGTIKYPVRNKVLLDYLRQLLPGAGRRSSGRVIPEMSTTSNTSPAKSPM